MVCFLRMLSAIGIVCCILFAGCSTHPKNTSEQKASNIFKLDTLVLFDKFRNRTIPVAIYQPTIKRQLNGIPVILNHGYGQNKGGDYLAYSYLSEFLASKGYFVVSVQHELPDDELLSMTGNLRQTRLSNWERGAANIAFVLQQMKTDFAFLDFKKLVLIGHSNGGDMSVLYAHQRPEEVNKLISPDNRRMELPRTSKPTVISFRSNDFPADEGVLPSEEEAQRFGMKIIFTEINHGHMDDNANESERAYFQSTILSLLSEEK